MNLFITIDPIFSGYLSNTLTILSFIAVLAAVLVIITKNPVTSVLFLIGLFFSIAGYLILIGLNFLGLSYLLVYVGAVSILFLFILMLINIRVSELISETQNSIALVIIVALVFVIAAYNIEIFKSITGLFMTVHNNWEENIIQSTHISAIGSVMYTNYAIFLILVSIILLLAMVGAIVITIKQKNIDLKI